MRVNGKDPPPDYPSPTHNIVHNGFLFQKKRILKNHRSSWCKQSRTEKCPIKLNVNTNDQCILKGKQIEGCKMRSGLGADINPTLDFTYKMRGKEEKLILIDLAMQSKIVWRRIYQVM